MAKIKTKKYTVDGEEIKVDFSCSSQGVFSFSMRNDIITKLGISCLDYSCLSLIELEKKLDNYILKYLESTKVNELVIGIIFSCGGMFANLPDKKTSFLPTQSKFRNNDYYKGSRLGFHYEIMIKQSYNNQVLYYNTENYKELVQKYGEHNPYKGDLIIEGYTNTSINHSISDYIFIPFTHKALANLESIQEQFRKASQFIYELVSSNDIELLLNSTNNNLINT